MGDPPHSRLGSVATTPVLPNPCHLRSAQSRDNAKFIHNPFHIGDEQQVHHLWGEEAQKGRNRNKNRGKKANRGIRYMKSACVYVPLCCLCSKIITQIGAAGYAAGAAGAAI